MWSQLLPATTCLGPLLFLQLDLVLPFCLYSGTQSCSFPLKLVTLRATAASSASFLRQYKKEMYLKEYLFIPITMNHIYLTILQSWKGVKYT